MNYSIFNPDFYNSIEISKIRGYILDDLGKHISTYRKQHNDSQELLAKSLGVTKSTISRYEKGVIEIPASILPLIARRYSVTVARMFNEQSLKGSMSGNDNINFMVLNTLHATCENEKQVFQYAPQIAEYYESLVETESEKSFDMFYIILQLIESINDLIDENDYLNREVKMKEVFDNFCNNVKCVNDNDYAKTKSIFAKKLIHKFMT